jgi:hypothetical protein
LRILVVCGDLGFGDAIWEEGGDFIDVLGGEVLGVEL